MSHGDFQSPMGSHGTSGLPSGGANPRMVNAMRRATHSNYPLASSSAFNAYEYGNRGTAVPEPLRALSAQERAINVVWRWSPDLGTYVSDIYPAGLP